MIHQDESPPSCSHVIKGIDQKAEQTGQLPQLRQFPLHSCRYLTAGVRFRRVAEVQRSGSLPRRIMGGDISIKKVTVLVEIA